MANSNILQTQKRHKIAYNFVKEELKAGEPNIFEIIKERLIMAAKKIKENNKDKLAKFKKK